MKIKALKIAKELSKELVPEVAGLALFNSPILSGHSLSDELGVVGNVVSVILEVAMSIAISKRFKNY